MSEIKQRLLGSVRITSLKSVITTRKGKDGKDVRGVFIPIDVNYLNEFQDKEGKACVEVPLSVVIKTEQDAYGQHGFIGQMAASSRWKEASDEEKEAMKKLPILGNLKDFTGGGGNEQGAEEVDGSDDLPW